MSLPPLVEPAAELTVDEVRRYSRHLIIPDVGMAGQKRLKNAKVLCVGAGGLGSPALMYLAAAGVGTLGIVDFDTVDESNLQRQIIHGQSDIGRSKAESAAASIREINPYVNVVIHNTALDRDNVMEIFAQYDLIVDGTDNFATRYMVNDAAVLLGKPYVWGSIYRFDGQASRVLGRARPLLPLPLPGAAAARHGPVLRRGRRARRAVRVDRLDPGHRGDQAAHRHRRAAGRPADGLRRPGDDVPQDQGPQGPELRALRREPDRHRPAGRLRGLLRRGLRGGARRRWSARRSPRRELKEWQDAGKDDLPGRRPRAGRVRDRPDPRRDADPQGRDPLRRGAGRAAAGQADRAALQVRRPLAPRRSPRSRRPASATPCTSRAACSSWVKQIDPSLPAY